MMSTSEEILECFEQEIAYKSKIIENKCGILSFYENGVGMRTFNMTDPAPCQTKYVGERGK